MKTKQRMIAAAAIAGMALLSACGGGSVSKDAAGTMMESKPSTIPVDPNKVDPAKFNKAHGTNGKVALGVNNGCTGCHE